MGKLKFAILGPGIISHRFVKGFRFTAGAELYAVASRDLRKAEDYAKEYQIPKAYGSYVEMLEDKEIDVVYVATPPFLHFEHVMLCLKAGMHVICEKPFMSNVAEAKEAFAYAKKNKLVLMEAMKVVFLPTTKQAKKWIAEGRIGEIRYIEASYCYRGNFPDTHWVYQKELAGGGMFDVGVYALAYANAIANSPIKTWHRLSQENKHGSDDFTQILIQYENGVIASTRGAIGLKTDNVAKIYGTEGKIEVENFWKSSSATLFDDEGNAEVFSLNQESEFVYQIQEMIDCVSTGNNESEIMSEAASLAILQLIEKY